MPNFNASTREMVSNIHNGLFVESGVSLFSVWVRRSSGIIFR